MLTNNYNIAGDSDQETSKASQGDSEAKPG